VVATSNIPVKKMARLVENAVKFAGEVSVKLEGDVEASVYGTSFRDVSI
jgi:hypothetical protein